MQTEFGMRVYRLRTARRLTQRRLGAMIGVSDKAVSRWETGTAIPASALLGRLAAALGTTVDTLLTGREMMLPVQESGSLPDAPDVPKSALKGTELIRMNLIPPGTNHPTGNYFCTWGIQNAIPPRYGLVGTGCSQMRDTMTAAHLFDSDDFHPVPRAERSGLYFLLDDGWDVPMGTRNPEDSSRMGRMVPDPEKFAALGDTDDARLRAMVQRAADLGYAGLGLWVSPQRPDRPADEPADPEADRPYWANRAALSGRAGVSYWKVDWGKACESVAYRTMMTECVRRYAPGLRIEHTLPIRALTGETDGDDPHPSGMTQLLAESDYMRTYDVVYPFRETETVLRLNWIAQRWDASRARPDALCCINVESEPAVAAGLGLHLGIMECTPTLRGVLRWQRFAPPFSVKDAPLVCSAARLTESYEFDVDAKWWLHNAGDTMTFAIPAAMVRNTRLPDVSCAGEAPCVLASVHPRTQAFAVSALRRTNGLNPMQICAADVTAYPASLRAPIGVFGFYRSLTLVFPEPIPAGCTVWAQCLAADVAQDITPRVRIDANRLTLDGRLLRQIGRAGTGYAERYDPMSVIVIR